MDTGLFEKFISDLRTEFSGYGPSGLTKDLMAGMTVAAVALPLALAFGVSSGADAAAGLITAIVAGLLVSPISGGYYQLSGPTGAMAAILSLLHRLFHQKIHRWQAHWKLLRWRHGLLWVLNLFPTLQRNSVFR